MVAESAEPRGFWEPTPVSKQLDQVLGFLGACKGAYNDPSSCPFHAGLDYRGPVVGPLRRFVLTVMEPRAEYRLVSRAGGRSVDWMGQLFESLTTGLEGEELSESVIFGSSKRLDRWIVIYGGSGPEPKRKFRTAVMNVLHSDDTDYWCIVWGRVKTCGPQVYRCVVTLFSKNWKV